MSDLTDPRIDERKPTFAKGPMFGGVPHTRVILFCPDASGEAAFLKDGALMEFFEGFDLGFNSWLYRWKGQANISGATWEAEYYWSGMDVQTGSTLLHANFIKFSSATLANYFLDSPPLDLSKPITVDLQGESPTGAFGSTCKKVDVPEWADPVEMWPNLTEFPLPP